MDKCCALHCREQSDDPAERAVQAEASQYGDILRLDSTDTYADLSSKTVKLFSKLPGKFRADFYFKVDDDVIVNVPALVAYLEPRRQHGNLYMVRGACEEPGCMSTRPALMLITMAPALSRFPYAAAPSEASNDSNSRYPRRGRGHSPIHCPKASHLCAAVIPLRVPLL